MTTVTASDEMVVLLDRGGEPCGVEHKHAVHDDATPLHLALSCYVVDLEGRVLLTKRSRRKLTWPSVWTNACCGHPRPGESIREATKRRLREELGLHAKHIALAFTDFRYRAVMENGTVENELCPVVVALVEGEPSPNPDEVDETAWCSWPEFLALVQQREPELSPWSVAQARRFAALDATPWEWLEGRAPHFMRRRELRWPDLDRPATAHAVREDPRHEVEAVLRRFLGAARARLLRIDPGTAPMADAVERLVGSGGKRLRPQFVHWGHRAAAGAADRKVPTVAAAVELLHTFALLHDDVMDRSQSRRGRPTAHEALAAHHQQHGCSGDGAWFGNSAAIVAGDLAFVWAQELFDAAELPASVSRRARSVFRDLQVEVMAGQFLDLSMTRPLGTDEAVNAARRVAMLKSGRYTVTRPLQLGAVIGGADEALLACLASYGDAVGVAFQLRDDVLGLMGDEAQTGKSTVDDLREGKRTVLILHALARSTPRDHAVVCSALGTLDVNGETCARVRDIVVRSGALDVVEREIEQLLDTAVAAATTLDASSRDALIDLAHRATMRRS